MEPAASVATEPVAEGLAALVLVTYERPPAPALLASLRGRVDLLVVVDNSTSPEAQAQIDAVCRDVPVDRTVVHNRKNLGTAQAFNIGIRAARAKECRWVYILDGDAEVEPEFFAAERELLRRAEQIAGLNPGVVVPVVSDEAPSLPLPQVAGEWSVVRSVIASGILMRVSTAEAVGGFNESLFVEGVDFDFAQRVRASGRRLIRLNRVLVHQSFGQPALPSDVLGRVLERVYALFYYCGILAGLSNSLHTRLSRYSLARRAELARYQRMRASLPATRWPAKILVRAGLLAQLLVDTLTVRDRRFLALGFSES